MFKSNSSYTKRYPISRQQLGLRGFPQNIYQAPLHAYPSQSYRVNNSNMIRVGDVVPTFGTVTQRFPLFAKIIIPGELYQYHIVAGNREYLVHQTYKLFNGDVIDVLGLASPTKRWRVKANSNYWDSLMIAY